MGYCYPGGDPRQHSWKEGGIPTPAAFKQGPCRSLGQQRAASSRKAAATIPSDAGIQVTATVTYYIKPERKCSSIQSQRGLVPQPSRVRPNVLLCMQTAGRHRGCGEQGRGCLHAAGRLHIQLCHAQARDHPSYICSLLRGWHRPPQSMESSPPCYCRRQLHSSSMSEHAEMSPHGSALTPQPQQCWNMAVATVGKCRPRAAACFGQCVPSPLYSLHLPRSISNLQH